MNKRIRVNGVLYEAVSSDRISRSRGIPDIDPAYYAGDLVAMNIASQQSNPRSRAAQDPGTRPLTPQDLRMLGLKGMDRYQLKLPNGKPALITFSESYPGQAVCMIGFDTKADVLRDGTKSNGVMIFAWGPKDRSASRGIFSGETWAVGPVRKAYQIFSQAEDAVELKPSRFFSWCNKKGIR